MTTADMLRAEGEVRGRAEALIEVLTLKFGPLPSATLDTVRTASTEQLRTWNTRVLTADTLQQTLR